MNRPGRGCVVICLIILGLTALLTLGRSLWLPYIGGFLIVADPLRPADAIVALSGGDRARVAYAAQLFNQGYADWFVATNMKQEIPGVRVKYGELVRQEAIWRGVPKERILIAPGGAETTYEEAMAVRQLVQEEGWHSLIIVTDPYHTRRARMAFQDVFRGTSITVTVQPVNKSWYKPDSWWKSQDGLRETWTEYLKLALYVMGYR
jgi:uncharacterized SAM-binding protein YcdF (DUF218 family)